MSVKLMKKFVIGRLFSFGNALRKGSLEAFQICIQILKNCGILQKISARDFNTGCNEEQGLKLLMTKK